MSDKGSRHRSPGMKRKRPCGWVSWVAGERSDVAAEQYGSGVADLEAKLRGHLSGAIPARTGRCAMAYVSNAVIDRKTFSSHATFDGNGNDGGASPRPPTRNPDTPPLSIC